MPGAPAPQPQRRRFVAPPRGSVPPQRFGLPLYHGFAAHRDWIQSPAWPAVEALDARLGAPLHPHSGVPLHFATQAGALLEDGLHYEQRILERGLVATRAGNWHDLFNAMVWIEQRPLKAALNLRQARDVARVGAAVRTRAQCALTHFDEAGAIVLLRDPALLAAWDRHDWFELFWRQRQAWSDGRAALRVFGHALAEHALSGLLLPTAKCIAVLLDHDTRRADSKDVQDAAAAGIADAIVAGGLLQDPQDLRPLPLAGIPGWDPHNGGEAFVREAGCFRPLRPGRRYPAPLGLSLP